jgi:hypothetical protein
MDGGREQLSAVGPPQKCRALARCGAREYTHRRLINQDTIVHVPISGIVYLRSSGYVHVTMNDISERQCYSDRLTCSDERI